VVARARVLILLEVSPRLARSTWTPRSAARSSREPQPRADVERVTGGKLCALRLRLAIAYGGGKNDWRGRFCREAPDVELEEAQAVLAAFAALRGRRHRQAASALPELISRGG
jgi:hypothetical protein